MQKLDVILNDLVREHTRKVHQLEAATGVRWETTSEWDADTGNLKLVAHRTDDVLIFGSHGTDE